MNPLLQWRPLGRLVLALLLGSAAAGPVCAQAPPNLDRVEFFLDTDPGPGLATAVPLTGPAASTRSNLNVPVPIGALAPGFHNLFIRSHDASGGWSQTLRRLFFIEDNSALTAPNLAEVEHFLDTDPGFGNGTSVALTGTSVSNRAIAVPIGALAPGFHRLFMRTRDVNNQWSQTFGRLFFVDDNSALTAPNLAEVEHFLDTDPGFGNGISTSLTGTAVTNRLIPVSLGALAPGFHRLFMRTRNVNNQWSQTFSRLFFIDDLTALVAPNLTRAEFFFDTDPGFGSGTAIATGAPATSYTSLPLAADASALADGPHRLFVRVRDASGRWSMVLNRRFVRSGCAAAENLAEGRPSADYAGSNIGGTAAEALFNGTGEAQFFNTNFAQADLGVATRTVSEARVSLRNPNGTAVSGTLALETSLNGTTFTTAGTVPVSLAASQASPQQVALPLGAPLANIRAVRLRLDLPSIGQGIRVTDGGVFFFNCVVPTISSFTPASGPVGTSVTFTGTNLTGASAVRFNGTLATTFSPVSATTVTATVPAGATTGVVSITTPNGTAVSATSFTVVQPAPTITSFNPTSGPVGTSVTLTGTSFGTATTVRFNGTSAPGFVVNSGTQITVTVPAGATTGPISVVTTGGTGTSATSFTVVQPPTISSFSPTSGPVGTSVTVTGTGFTGASTVSFNGTPATSFTVGSATSITATVPTGATTGPVSVTTGAGTGTSAASFTVTGAAPTVTAFSPASGPVGTSVTVTGTGFTGATSVRFNGTVASFTAGNATSLTATVPAGATTGPMSVTTPNGTGTSAAAFTVMGAPVTDITFFPPSGAPGSVVLVTDAAGGFTAATSARFNGAAATGTVLNSAGQVTATVPGNATTGPLTTLTGATVLTGAGFTVTGGPAPVVRHFSPLRAPIGTEITVQGANFTGVTQVRFGPVVAPGFTVVSATQLTVPVPAGATTGSRIYVLAGGGLAQSMRPFTLIVPPTITGFFPSQGAVGSLVILTGTNLTNASGVTVGGVAAADFTVDSPTQITATVPPGAVSGPVEATTVAGTATSATSFNVVAGPAPAITAFSPASGPAGTSVVLTGAGLGGTTSVRFNGTEAAGFVVSSATQLTATVPVGARSGRLTVLNARGLARSATDFRVTVPVPAPSLTAFAPASGSPGALVLLTGANLGGATQVRFSSNVPATAFTVNSPTQITATIPAGAATGPILVTTPGGTASTATAFTITAAPAPSVLSFSPASGPVGAGVTVTGSGFTGVTAVRLGSAPVAGLTVNSTTSLSFTVPVGAASGVVRVFAAGGLQQSATAFTVVPPPTLTAFSPAAGSPGSQVVLTGTALTDAATVRFGGVTAPAFTVVSATRIIATVPAGAASGALSVTTPGGTATSAGSFTVTVPPPPTITALSPGSGIVGAVVQISGTNLFTTTSVRFNGTPVESFVVGSATQLLAQVPGGATTGRVSLTTTGGQAVSAADFTVLTPPDIDALAPVRGPVGTVVTLRGTGLAGATGVRFGGVAAVAFSASPDGREATATVPAGTATGQVSLTNPVATAVSAQVFTLTLGRQGGVGWVATDEVQVIPYPNPAASGQRLTVWVNGLPALQGTATVQLYDALGRLLATSPVDGQTAEATFELNALATGIYVVRCGESARQVLVTR